MCTLSWRRDPSGLGLEVFFNRDEKRTRGSEIAPQRSVTRGTTFVAPRDSDGGGSWIGVNEHGLVVALLNGYREVDRFEGEFLSRGGIVLDLLAERDCETAAGRLSDLDLPRFRSFVVALFESDRESTSVAVWDREKFTWTARERIAVPILSSSFDAIAVGARRREVFDALPRPLTTDSLIAAHRNHGDAPSAYSACMHRPDAETRSFTRIRVDRERARLTWHGAAPCQDGRTVTIDLERQTADRAES